jgi:hypothetical protein
MRRAWLCICPFIRELGLRNIMIIKVRHSKNREVNFFMLNYWCNAQGGTPPDC